MIKCYVINLSRRKDRLEKIRKHLSSLKLDFVRFEAIDYLKVSKERLMKNMKWSPVVFELAKARLDCQRSKASLMSLNWTP